MTMRQLIAGNWKMNGLAADLDEARRISAELAQGPAHCEVALCPPATLIDRMVQALPGTEVLIGAQDCAAAASGAFTGDISAEQIADAGASLVILGHSERRAGHGETSEIVAEKVLAALRAGLRPIVCVGESLEERDAGWAQAITCGQVEDSLPDEIAGEPFAVAYEPVWAIGTGRTANLEQIGEMHDAIREVLIRRFGDQGADVPILYGGSVKPSNAEEILAVENVGGALVGGASLKAADFIPIIRAAR